MKPTNSNKIYYKSNWYQYDMMTHDEIIEIQEYFYKKQNWDFSKMERLYFIYKTEMHDAECRYVAFYGSKPKKSDPSKRKHLLWIADNELNWDFGGEGRDEIDPTADPRLNKSYYRFIRAEDAE